MGIELSKEDIQAFIKDSKLVDDIVARSLKDEKATEELAEEVAEAISEAIEDDPTYKQKLIQAAGKDSNFKKKVYERLLEKVE